jgi:hypothetical protein
MAPARSSRGRWKFFALTELSPELLQSVEESLPSRFNRMAAHDVPLLMHAVDAQCQSRATRGAVCAIFTDAAEPSAVSRRFDTNIWVKLAKATRSVSRRCKVAAASGGYFSAGKGCQR